MLILLPPCSTTELSALRAFRRTASDVHRIYSPLAHHSVALDLRDPGSQHLGSFPEDALRSLAMAVRQAYMPSEVTHFESIRRIVGRSTAPEVREYLDILKHDWHFALVSPMGLRIGDYTYGGRQVFETWLYARAIHRDLGKQVDAERLDTMDLLPTWVVQLVVRGLAICILQLDVAVAEALGEDPLPNDVVVVTGERPFRF